MAEEISGDAPEKTVVDIAIERMRQELEGVKAELKAATDSLAAVTKERNQAASFLEQNERGIAIKDLEKMGCTYSAEEFDKMTLDQLAELKSHYKYFNPPTFKSGADVSGKKESIFTALDDVYVSLEDRKKNYSEA
jgi:hypothetical protein